MVNTAEQEVVLTRGEDAVLPFAGLVTTDLSLWALAFSVAAYNGKSVLLTVPSGDGISGQAADGSFLLTVSAARTAALARGLYRWDLWRTDGGSQAPLAGGPLRVREPVRRPA